MVAPAGIPSAQAVGVPTVVRIGVKLIPAGIPTAQAFGTAVVGRGAVTLAPAGIASAQAFGRPTVVRAAVTLAPTGIASAQAFGTPQVVFGAISPVRQTVAPTAIASTQAFGAAAVKRQLISLYPVGWAEPEPFGIATLTITYPALPLFPVGIAPAQTFGQPLTLTVAPPAPPGGGPPAPVATPRNYLIDRLTREVYPWPVNHQTEDGIKVLGRQLQRSGVNPGGFMIRQRTHPGPLHLALHGALIDQPQTQYRTFVRFFQESDTRTFDYIDASGDSYHVALVSFDARRKRSPAHLNGSYFEYTLDVEVIAVNQGALAGYV